MTDSLRPMTRILGSIAVALLLAVLAVLAPARAFAHPLVDQAMTAYQSAQLDRGLELLDQAEQGTDLTRDDLAELLILRAMIHRAQRNMDLAEVDLLRLAGLDPERVLDRQVHPTLRRLFATVRERVPRAVRLDVTAERDGERVRISVAVVDDVAALTQGFRMHARPVGGTWRETTDSTLTVDARRSEAVEYWAEGIGPGGAPVATLGSATEPARLEPAAGSGELAGDGSEAVGTGGTGQIDEGSHEGSDEGLPAWPFVVGAVALVVVAAVVLGVFFGTQPTDETQINGISVSLVSRPPVLLRFDL